MEEMLLLRYNKELLLVTETESELHFRLIIFVILNF